MTDVTVRTTPPLFKITVLSASLFLAACGSSGPRFSAPPAPPVTAAQPQEQASAEPPAAPAATADTLSTSSAATRLQPGVAGGGRTQSDAGADGGMTVALLGNGHAATFAVPSGGTFTATLQARQTAYQGNAVLSVRVNGAERRRVELTSTSYAAAALGDLTLAAGDVVSVVFVNDLYGGIGKDRNAYVDHLTLTPVGGAVAPAPAPTPTPAPAPTPPTAGGVDVRTFGARGDGVTDDTAALQRAAGSGQSLHFPAGTYLISRAVTLSGTNGVSVSGQGATLRARPGFSGAALLHLVNTTATAVRGLTVIGAGEGTGWIDGIRVSGGSGAVVEGNTLRQLGGAGVQVENASGTTVSHNTVSEVKYHGVVGMSSRDQRWTHNRITGHGASVITGGIGLLGHLGDGYLIEGNVITAFGNTATKTEGTSNVIYRGNTVDGFAKDGIKIMPLPEKGVTHVTNGVIENNTVRGYTGAESHGSTALQMSSVLGGRISGNTTHGTFGQDAGGRTSPSGFEDAIRLQAHGSGPQPRNIVISGNTVINSQVGLRLMGQGNTVSDNVIQRSAQYSVIFNRGASDNTFTGNTFSGAGPIGVLFDHEVSRTTFSSNSFAGMGTGIYAANNGNNHNTFRGNAFTAVTKAVVVAGSGNTCTANTGAGVSLSCQ